MFDTSCKNILVRGVNWIGDSVMTLPALRALRKALPESRISLLVKPWVSAVFDKDPNIDELLFYDDIHTGIIGKLKLSRMLNKKKFCGALLFQNAFDAALIAFLSGIKYRAGYDRDGRGFLLTEKVPVPGNEKKEHQIFYYLNLLNQLGISAPYSEPYIHLTVDERLCARDIVKEMKRPLLGINPGATYGSAKRWFPERFAEIANWFISDTGGSVILFGGNQEVAIADEIYKQVIPEFRTTSFLASLAGKSSLRDLIALIAECNVFLTNDSGPMHIAYAVRTPLVALFGSTDPVLTGPPPQGHKNSHVVIKPDLSCSPCFERTCRNKDMRCMYAVTSDEVYYGIKKILPQSPAVFFDRDGTLNRDTGYINRREDLHIFPDITETGKLKEAGFKIIGISNQSGIARGLVGEQFIRETSRLFIEQYGFDDFYHCPHHPDEHCSCRKPEPEMLFRARSEHGIDLQRSFVVGDKEADMLLAKAVGAKCIFMRTGQTSESPNADFTASTLSEAVQWIIEKTPTAGKSSRCLL
jgi:heptosyltransferase II